MSNTPRIVGLTGPVQNGKIQLTHVFQKCGWTFVDLNDATYNFRVKGTPEYDRLQSMIAGSIDDEGVETGTFYQAMTPALYCQLLSGYTDLVRKAAVMACANRKPDERIVLSWEYLARIAPGLPIDHFFLFGSARQIWFDRMRARAVELSDGKWMPTDAWLEGVVKTLDVEPDTISVELRAVARPEQITVIDVGAADWGEAKLRAALAIWD